MTRYLQSQDPSKRTLKEYLQHDYDFEQEQQISEVTRGKSVRRVSSFMDQLGRRLERFQEEEEYDDDPVEPKNRSNLQSPRVLVFSLAGALVFTCGLALLMVLAPQFQSREFTKRESLVPAETMALKESVTVTDEEKGIVASDHPVCSRMGLATLKKGGNAVDAAIVTALCLGVANPASSGIGGGAFILISINPKVDRSNNNSTAPSFIDARDPYFKQPVPGKILEVIDCREIAPLAATETMFDNLPEDASTIGGLAIAVPGELRGLELAHARWGQLPWREVVRPVQELASEGVAVIKYLETAIQEHAGARLQFSNLKKILTKDNDEYTYLKEGDILRNGPLAGTLEAIMEHGSDAVYRGGRTPRFLEDIKNAGGIISAADLMQYKPTIRDPLVGRNIRGYALIGVPPPSSGGAAVIGAARFLAGYDKDERNPPSAHRLVEAMKHAFSIRMSLSDPSFPAGADVNEAVQDLVYNEYMETLRRETLDNKVLPLSQYGGTKWAQLQDNQGQGEAIDAKEGDRKRRRLRLRDSHNPNFGYLEDHGTTHLSVVDSDYNAVSITSSVNTYFGSGIVAPHSGILLNSQMDDFSTPGRANFFGLEPSEANYIAPSKKPLSSMSPFLVYTETGNATSVGHFAMALGASGGPKIITAVLQTFINFALKKMPLFEAMAYPRLHAQLLYHEKDVVLFEETTIGNALVEVSERTRNQLTRTGHSLLSVGYTGAVQAIALDQVTWRMDAVSDFRKGGKPAGY